MSKPQPTIPGLEPPTPDDGELVRAVMETIAALREAGALHPWHSALCASAIHAARRAEQERGIAATNWGARMSEALKALPEPVIVEESDRVQTELERIAEYIAELEASDPADLPHAALSASVD